MRFASTLSGMIALAAVLSLNAPAAALPQGGPPNVAIVAAAQSSTSSPWFTDPQAKLMASGLFGQVDIINASIGTPNLAQLQMYDAVLTWSNATYFDATALGDVLADYVDAGGGVVLATFANSDTLASRALQGRWATGGYSIIVPQLGTTTGMATLGIAQPNHPIMAGVLTFNGGSESFRPTTTTMTPGSQVIASWSDGKILVAQHGTMPGRIDLGFYPTSSAASSGFWDTTTDGGVLMSNAVFFVAGNGTTGTPFCAGDGTGTACPCGNSGAANNGCASSVSPGGAHLTATGSAHLSNDTVVLQGSSMPNSSALYFQGTAQTAGGAGTVFGDGLRCAGGAIIRLKAVTNVGGASQYPGTGDIHISLKGAITTPGLRTYQVWYRNAASFCTPSTFNLTNGIQVDWMS